mgnify:CR=1 FL=1
MFEKTPAEHGWSLQLISYFHCSANGIPINRDEACLTVIELDSNVINVEFSKLAKNRHGQYLACFMYKNVVTPDPKFQIKLYQTALLLQ